MITGSCLCGEVTYEISGKVGDIVHCHCQTCRKAHGAAFSSVAAVDDDPQSQEKEHIWVSQKASWYEINNDLPEHQEYE